jgi:Family of unknown function (DUF5706)
MGLFCLLFKLTHNGRMQNIEKVSILEKTLERLLAWIRATESKVTLILPLSTAMLSLLAILSPKFTEWSVCAGIFSAFAVLFLISTIICAAIASFPRTEGPKSSLIYFGGISSRDERQLHQDITALTETNYIEDLTSQC